MADFAWEGHIFILYFVYLYTYLFIFFYFEMVPPRTKQPENKTATTKQTNPVQSTMNNINTIFLLKPDTNMV